MGARDLRTLWSCVLQHHHHHLRQAFASRFGFLSNASERKPETELLVWKHERIATEKKRSWSWSAPIKIFLLFSSLLFFSYVLCPPPPLFSPAATQRSSSRPRSFFLFSSSLLSSSSLFSSVLFLFSRLQQCNAPPPSHVPPMLATRERPCLHRLCWEPENGCARSTCAGDQRVGRPSVTDPAWHPPRRARSVEIRESGSAGPSPVGLLWQTRAPWQTDKRINI